MANAASGKARSETLRIIREKIKVIKLHDGESLILTICRSLAMGIEVQSTRTYRQLQGQIKSPESTNLLYTSTSKCMTSQNSLFQIPACNKCTKKSSSKSISSAICIHDLLVCQLIDGEELWFVGLVSRDHNGAFGTLGENHDTAARRIGFGRKSDAARNACNVFGVWVTCCVCVCLSLSLVADEDIGVRQNLFQLLFEKLGDERGGDVQGKSLTTINSAICTSVVLECIPFQQQMPWCSAQERIQCHG